MRKKPSTAIPARGNADEMRDAIILELGGRLRAFAAGAAEIIEVMRKIDGVEFLDAGTDNVDGFNHVTFQGENARKFAYEMVGHVFLIDGADKENFEVNIQIGQCCMRWPPAANWLVLKAAKWAVIDQ
jgi:hypothetical protein